MSPPAKPDVGNPLSFLNEFAKLHPELALPIFAGLALFAAATVAAAWGGDLQQIKDYVAAIFIWGILLVAAVRLINHVAGSRLFMNILASIVIAYLLLFLYALIARNALLVNCLTKPWSCEVAEEYSGKPKLPDLKHPTAKSVVPADVLVYVQFAGRIDRNDVASMMRKLADLGWRVQGVQGGGERTASAAGYNEVRYSAGAGEAARVLASQVQEINLTKKPIKAVEAKGVSPGALEVWISN